MPVESFGVTRRVHSSSPVSMSSAITPSDAWTP